MKLAHSFEVIKKKQLCSGRMSINFFYFRFLGFINIILLSFTLSLTFLLK